MTDEQIEVLLRQMGDDIRQIKKKLVMIEITLDARGINIY